MASFFVHGHSIAYDKSDSAKLALFDFYHITHWTPLDVQLSDLRILQNKLKGFGKMAHKKQFVLNNLTDDELLELDRNYPDVTEIDLNLGKAITEHDFTFAIQLDKNGSYICYGNQSDYAVSARSIHALDAVVIVLHKIKTCDYNLASKATAAAQAFRRG